MTRWNEYGFRGSGPEGPNPNYIEQKGPLPNGGEGDESQPHGLYLDDGDVRLYHGDALSVLQTLEDASVHMCVTSPPFYGLRDYGTGRWEGGNPDCDHARPPGGGLAKGEALVGTGNRDGYSADGQFRDVCGKCGARRVDQQIGLEETPEQWVAALVAVFREVRRVLRPEGTLWLEIGDSYGAVASSPGANIRGGLAAAAEKADGRPRNAENRRDQNREGYFPDRFRHPYKPKDLIGAPWQLAFALRNDGWYLRSDIVWSRPNPMPESVTDRPTKSHSYVFLLSKAPRYFFDQEAVREPADYGRRNHNGSAWGTSRQADPADARDTITGSTTGADTAAGRNVRSVWNIATQPYPGAHFATFPEELARRCILAGSPEHGLVLDPFVGSGTVPHVARKHGRHAIGIDLSSSYLELARPPAATTQPIRMSSQAWKGLERRVCRDMGLTRRGQVTAGGYAKGSDNTGEGPVSLEVKMTTRYQLRRSWVEQARKNSDDDGRPWVLVIAEHRDRRKLAVMDYAMFLVLYRAAMSHPLGEGLDAFAQLAGMTSR